jgi:predicted nucleic acid-binding protein
MGGKAFVDTNVLLRAIHSQLHQHTACEALVQKMWEENVDLWVSRQVIREYLVQVTHSRTFAIPLSPQQVTGQIDMIQTLFHVADETQAVTDQLLQLCRVYQTGGKQIHDANIVAVMVVYGIDRLITLNTADFKRYEDRISLVTF